MSSETEWRWADPNGQQRLIRTDELLAALSNGVIPPNAPVWKQGWTAWKPANETPELMTSALAAENGLLPNIPPPPLFVVAAQTEYEGKPVRTTDKGAGPPAPPRYVPLARKPPSHPSGGTLSPPANAFAAPPQEVPSQRAFAVKKTMVGMPPVGGSPAPIVVPPARSSSTLVQGRPHVMPAMEDNTAVNMNKVTESQAAQLVAEKKKSVATVVGVPALQRPNTQGGPPPTPSSSAPARHKTPPMPTAVEQRESSKMAVESSREPPLKRQTLILYGGAPSSDSPPPASTEAPAPAAPPIVVPGPGTQANKNAVTRPPPWGEGAVAIGPEFPKASPTPRMDGQSRKDGTSATRPWSKPDESAEELSGSVLLDSLDEPAPKRPRSTPPPLKPRSLPPPKPKPRLALSPDEAMGGILVDPDTTGPRADSEMRLPIHESLYDRVRRVSKTNYEFARGKYDLARGKIDRVTQERMPGARAKLDKFAEGKPKHFLPVISGLVALVSLIVFIAFVNALRSCGAQEETAKGGISAKGLASGATATSTPSSLPEPVSSAPPCLIAGPPRTLAPRALVPSGIEVLPYGSSVVIGFASTPRDGEVFQVDPGKLTPGRVTRVHTSEPLRRVTPVAAEGRPLLAAGDVDRKGDKIAGRRTLVSSSSAPIDLGSAEGNLVWASHGSERTSTLWALPGEGNAEALRGVPLDGNDKGFAVAFRRASAIGLGILLGEKTFAPKGELATVPGLGTQVGSPAIAASGEWILAVWADRAGPSEPWGLRWLRWKLGDAAPEAPRRFAPPPGGPGAPSMSPGVTGLGGGRFLLVWTEGPVSSHQVRGQTVSASGEISGAPLTISAEGTNAGQGQAAVGSDGSGVVAYLVSNGKNFEVVATPITCAR